MSNTLPAGLPASTPAEALALTLDAAESGQIADAIVIRRSSLPAWLPAKDAEAVRSDLWAAASKLMSAQRRMDSAARRNYR